MRGHQALARSSTGSARTSSASSSMAASSSARLRLAASRSTSLTVSLIVLVPSVALAWSRSVSSKSTKCFTQREAELYWAVHEARHPSRPGDALPE